MMLPKRLTLERPGEFQHDIPKETRLPHGGVVYAITKHKVVARISGLGMLGSDLVREAGICLQATANKDGYAQSFHQSEALQHPLLGAVHITLLSRFLILYGFLACQIDIPEVAEQINLLDISVVMTQLVTLTNLDKPEQTETAKPFDIPLFKLSESKPDTLPRSLIKGESFHLCENAIRLPSDNTTRQTTSVWSNTGIRLSHKLSVLIRYREHTPSADVKELTVRFNARLSSCAYQKPHARFWLISTNSGDHSLANLSLPDYADSEKGKVYRKAGIPDCLCQLHEFIGEEEVERIYGVGAIQADQVAGRGLSGRAKWEDRQTSERD